MQIATHDGTFHADEVFGVAILLKLFPNANVIRTREEELLRKANIRLDVGKKYDHTTKDYDHHMLEGAGKRENDIPYASAGLIWKHYGKELCEEDIWEIVDQKLIQPIDAGDNGVPLFDNPKIEPYTIRDLIKSFNSTWDSVSEDQNTQFRKIVGIAQMILEREILFAKGKIAARDVVMKSLATMKDGILILESYCPWEEYVIPNEDVKLVIFGSEDRWLIHTVPKQIGSFESKLLLPESWAGLDNIALEKTSGVAEATFCHRARFIAGAKSREAALRLAKLALGIE